MRKVMLGLLLLITCYLLLVTFATPTHAQNSCDQACFDRLDQCQNDDCVNRSPGRDHDNCINDCVQTKDRCINACHGRSGGACHPISAAELVSVDLNQGTNVTFTWNQPADPDPVNGGCDGKGRNFTVYWGDCPAGTTQYSSACSEPKGQVTLAAGPERPFTTTGDVGGNKDTIHYWHIHTQCNCGASVDSEKVIFTTNPFLCNSKSREEQAVCHQNNYLLPQGVAQYTPPRDVFQTILAQLQSIIATLLWQRPSNTVRMYDQSGNVDQANVPTQIKPESNIVDNFKGYLGERSGIYSVSLPNELKCPHTDNEAIRNCEKNYEQAYFPVMDGQQIRPITPEGGTTTQPPANNPPPGTTPNACQQACFTTLDQELASCESQTGHARDSCINDAVQKKDRCLRNC